MVVPRLVSPAACKRSFLASSSAYRCRSNCCCWGVRASFDARAEAEAAEEEEEEEDEEELAPLRVHPPRACLVDDECRVAVEEDEEEAMVAEGEGEKVVRPALGPSPMACGGSCWYLGSRAYTPPSAGGGRGGLGLVTDSTGTMERA